MGTNAFMNIVSEGHMQFLQGRVGEYVENQQNLNRVQSVSNNHHNKFVVNVDVDGQVPVEATFTKMQSFDNHEPYKAGRDRDVPSLVPSNQGRTSAITSTFAIVNKNPIEKGDMIIIKINTYDNYKNIRSLGGDLLRATLFNKDDKFATMGRIVDHENGSYTAYFYAGYAGKVSVEVVLALQREAIQWQDNVFRKSEPRAWWVGKFIQGDTNETSQCYVIREGTWTDKCDFPYGKALGKTRFLCDTPKSLPCHTLSYISSLNMPPLSSYLISELIEHDYLFEAPNAMQLINGSVSTLVIEDSKPKDPKIPRCQADLPVPPSDGYWLGDRWHSRICTSREWLEPKDVQQCLRGKNVYFLGDSTTRQWFQKFLEIAGYPLVVTDSNWRQRVVSIPKKYRVVSACKCDSDFMRAAPIDMATLTSHLTQYKHTHADTMEGAGDT
ncbi:NXPE family member 1-like [Ptychodera flava]|uniref:NXPE family member 1-like n=1 Tax=Ptychodera flava TaxID=63121 RepID=UPI00396A4AB5